MKAIEYFSVIVQLKIKPAIVQFPLYNIPRILMYLIDKFSMDSQLHNKVFTLFQKALFPDPLDPMQSPSSMALACYPEEFFVDCRLPNILVDLWNKKEFYYKNTGKKFNKSYTPFVANLAMRINETALLKSRISGKTIKKKI